MKIRRKKEKLMKKENSSQKWGSIAKKERKKGGE